MKESHPGKFISLHGIDGTGKTHTAQEIYTSLSSQGVRVINYDTFKEGLDNPHKKKEGSEAELSLEDQMANNLASMMFHSDQIRTLLDEGYHVVKSRYLDDIKAHFSHLGVGREKVEELVRKFPMIQPDLKVILVLDENMRRSRIETREILDEKDKEVKTHGSRAKYFEDYLLEEFSKMPEGSMLKIDTGALDAKKVAQKIIDQIIT